MDKLINQNLIPTKSNSPQLQKSAQ